jgi:hypothetical protein
LSTNYSEALPVFVPLPTDEQSNNARILVNRSAVEDVKILQPA